MTNNPHIAHENELINRLIIRDKRERISSLLKSKKGRTKLRRDLAHNFIFDSRYSSKIPVNTQTTNLIYDSLRGHNAPDECYLISENSKLDGKFISLKEAIDLVIGLGFGSIISCIPGKLVYYEGEEMNQRYIIKRND